MKVLLYIPFVIFFGWLNAYLVFAWVDWGSGKKLSHFLNGCIHLTAAVIAYFIYKSGAYCIIFHQHVSYNGIRKAVALLLLTKVFFDLSYAFFHTPRLPLDYVSITPKSILDKWERKVFGRDGITPKLIYLAIAVTLICW